MADKIKDQDIEISRLKARVKSLEDKESRCEEPIQEDAPITGGIIDIGEELGADKSKEKWSNDTEEMVNVLSLMEAANILSSGGAAFSTASVSATDVFPTTGVPTVSAIFTTASVATPYTRRSRSITIGSLRPMRISIISPKYQGKEKVTKTKVPKKKKLQEQIDAQVARKMEEEFARENQRSDEVIAKHLSEYEQAEADLSEELGADKSTEKGSNDTEEMVNVLSSMEAANILLSGGAAFSTASVSPADVFPTGGVPTISGNFPTVAREMEKEFARENQRLSEQAARDFEIARIHAEEELKLMIEGLDRSNEVIAEHLSEYKQAEADLSVGEKIELISELVKYQNHLAEILKYQAQQSKPSSKKEQRRFYMSVLKSHAGWKTTHFRGMTLEQIKENFIPVWKHMQDFVPMSLIEEKPLKEQQFKVSKGVSEEELKGMMQLVPLEEVYIEALQKLYYSCDVHHVSTKKNQEIFMLVEKDYPLRKGLATVMIIQDEELFEASSPDSEASSSSFDDKIAKVSYYTSESKNETLDYYDNSTTYSLFMDNNNDQEIFHDSCEIFSKNLIESQIDHNESDVTHNDSEDVVKLINQMIKEFDKNIAKYHKRFEKANQQSKDFENQTKFLQENCDVLQNQTNIFEVKNNELNEHIKVLIEKNHDLLAQTKALQEQLKVKHVVIDNHIADQEILFDKMSHQLIELDENMRMLKNTILEKDLKFFELAECVRNKDLEIEKCLERLNECKNKLHKFGQTNHTIHMIMPSKDKMYNGRKGIGFENPNYFCKAKDLRPTLYYQRVSGRGYTSRFLIHSDEALEIEKFKRAKENKTEFLYDYGSLNTSYVNEMINFSDDYFQEIINQDFKKIDSPFQQTSSLKPYVLTVILEKIIIDLEDEVVHLDTLSSVRRPKPSGVIWMKKGSSNTVKADLSSVNHSNSNKNVKRYSCKDLMLCNNSHLRDTRSAHDCNNARNSYCNPYDVDVNNLFVFDDFLGTVRFENNDFVIIAGYGDVVIGSMTIKKVYYVEGLVHHVRTDNGTEFKNKTLAKFFDEAEAIATACFTQNHSIIHKYFDKTPYELMNKRKPNIKFFHVFGCRCYLLNDYDDVGKLKAKGDIGVFVGYSKESAAFRIYNKRTHKIHESMNVNFDEISKMASKQFSLEPDLNKKGKS
nr:hypothetical protein [Tanacetum cinerariifolium]